MADPIDLAEKRKAKEPRCRWCGAKPHGGDYCPTIEAIEYYDDGAIARVEFRDLREDDETPTP